MNLFVLHTNPVIAARMHCDRHVVKMITETAQLLSYVHHTLNPKFAVRVGMYRVNKAHMKHPCTLWMLENSTNYRWAYELLLALLDEYEHRYKPTKPKYVRIRELLPYFEQLPNKIKMTRHDKPLSFVLAMKKAPQCMTENAVDSYRRYYIVDKAGFAKWTRRKQPRWMRYKLSRPLLTKLNARSKLPAN